MAGDPQVLGLLEEMLSSGKTPEEVCRHCPELLPEVRRRWQQFQLVDAQVRSLLPGPETSSDAGATTPPEATDVAPITEQEVLGPSEAMRAAMGGVAIEANTRAILEKLARTEPTTLALMHGSSYRGNGAALLKGLADALGV